MHTVAKELTIVGDSAYWGDRRDWLLALAVHRDSDLVTRSNWQVACEAMPESEDWAIERFSHWAVGWVDYLLVKPGSDAETTAQGLLSRLEDYPILDEDEHGRLEWEEATDYWASLPLAERVGLCGRFGVSIFAARRDDMPDSAALHEYLTSR